MTTARLDGSGIESLAHAVNTVHEAIDDCMKKLSRYEVFVCTIENLSNSQRHVPKEIAHRRTCDKKTNDSHCY